MTTNLIICRKLCKDNCIENNYNKFKYLQTKDILTEILIKDLPKVKYQFLEEMPMRF